MSRVFINGKEVSKDELSNIEIRSEEVKNILSKYLTNKTKGDGITPATLKSTFSMRLPREKVH